MNFSATSFYLIACCSGKTLTLGKHSRKLMGTRMASRKPGTWYVIHSSSGYAGRSGKKRRAFTRISTQAKHQVTIELRTFHSLGAVCCDCKSSASIKSPMTGSCYGMIAEISVRATASLSSFVYPNLIDSEILHVLGGTVPWRRKPPCRLDSIDCPDGTVDRAIEGRK